MNQMFMNDDLKSFIINFRRELHMYPEVSFKEFETCKRIKRELDRLGIPYHSVTETGIVADIIGGQPGKTVALRADMDALEINEETEFEFKSKNNGVMHACGHDGHVASLLGAASILNERRDSLKGNVKLIFQPAEELVSGAKLMLETEAILEDVDNVFAIHVMPDYPCGTVIVREGVSFSAGEAFFINIKGKSGHGAQPHKAVDALLAASATVMNIQSIVSHEVNPSDFAVITIGTLEAGTRLNIIAGEAKLSGTIRTYSEELHSRLRNSISRIVKNTAETYGARAETIFIRYVPSVINDPFSTKLLIGSAAKIIDEKNIIESTISSGSDDMSFFLKEKPGCYAFVGCGSIEKQDIEPLHSSRFVLEEDSLLISALLYAQYAEDFLNA